MLNRIFPKVIDNTYRGHWLGVGLFVLVVLLKGTQGVASMFNTRETLINADGVPLTSFDAGAAETVVSMFALLGMYVLIVPLLSLVVLVRWRALIPFMFLVLLAVQLGARLVLMFNPIAKSASASSMSFAGHAVGFYVNLAILAITVVGVALSLRNSAVSPVRNKPI